MRSQQYSPSKKQQGAVLINLLVILLLAAVLAGGWFGWHQLNALNKEYEALQQRLGDIASAQKQSRGELDQQQATLNERLDDLDVSMASRDEILAQMQAGGQRNWLLNEAEALASLAQERLVLTADIAAARRLLEASDKTLARLNDTRMLPARKALAADLEKLRGAQQVDVQALLLQLGALQEMLDDVVLPVSARENVEVSRPRASADASWWEKLIHGLPVTVRHQEAAFPLPLDAEQASSLRLYLGNALQQAQLSVLQGRPQGYRQALQQADTAVVAWLDKDNSRVKHLRVAMDELASADIEQALPEIGAGLAAIRGLQAELNK